MIRLWIYNYHYSCPCQLLALHICWYVKSFDESRKFERKFLPLTGNFVLWQEISSCKRKFLSVVGISSCGLKFCPLRGKFFLWKEFSSCDRKCLPVTGYFFLPVRGNVFYERKFLPVSGNLSSDSKDHPATGVSSCDREFLSLIWNFVLSEEISSCDSTFLPVTGNFFLS